MLANSIYTYQNLTFICVSNIFPSEPRLRIWRSWVTPALRPRSNISCFTNTSHWNGSAARTPSRVAHEYHGKKYYLSHSVSRAICNSTLDKTGTLTPSTNDRTCFDPSGEWRAVRIGISCAAHGPGFLPPLFLCVLP